MPKDKNDQQYRRFISLSKIIGIATAILPNLSKNIHHLFCYFEKYSDPVVANIEKLLNDLKQERITPEYFVSEIQKRYDDIDITTEFNKWICDIPLLRSRCMLYQKEHLGGKVTIQIFYISPNHSHPPHAHHNVLSTQCVLKGDLYLREYDRIERVDEKIITLRPTSDKILTPYEYYCTTEYTNNVHWFGAGEKPAIVMNFNVKGMLNQTFDDKMKNSQRCYLDPTGPIDKNNLIYAREINSQEAFSLFANKSLRKFPTY